MGRPFGGGKVNIFFLHAKRNIESVESLILCGSEGREQTKGVRSNFGQL